MRWKKLAGLGPSAPGPDGYREQHDIRGGKTRDAEAQQEVLVGSLAVAIIFSRLRGRRC